MNRAIVSGMMTLLASGSFVYAADQLYGSEADARAMEMRALNALKADEKAALEKFNDANGGFRDRDLYVFCFDIHSGKFLAQVNKTLLGKDNRLLKEKDGSPLGQKVYDAANATPPGQIATVSYNYPRPGTEQPMPKVTFIGRVNDTACGVGYYK